MSERVGAAERAIEASSAEQANKCVVSAYEQADEQVAGARDYITTSWQGVLNKCAKAEIMRIA